MRQKNRKVGRKMAVLALVAAASEMADEEEEKKGEGASEKESPQVE